MMMENAQMSVSLFFHSCCAQDYLMGLRKN